MMSFLKYIGIMFAMSLFFPVFGSELKEDEDVILYPGYLYLDSSLKEYSLKIHIHVFKKKEDSLKRKILIENLKDHFITSDDIDSKVFEERMRSFLVDNKRDKKISISVFGESFTLNPTEANGHSITEIKISPDKIGQKELTNKLVEVKVNPSKKK